MVQDAAAQLQAQLGDPAAVFLATSPAAGKVAMAVAVSPAAVEGGLNAGKLVGGLAKLCGGGGGGRPNLAQVCICVWFAGTSKVMLIFRAGLRPC